jgi:signal transduction histidine kinase
LPYFFTAPVGAVKYSIFIHMKIAGISGSGLLALMQWLGSCTAPYPADAVVSLPDYKKGEALMGVNSDSAFYYFNQVVNTSRDSLEIATSLNNMAVIQADAGDYFGSQESLLHSLQYLNEARERDHYCLAADYNELGTSSLNLRNYDAAIRYYDMALQFSRDDNFSTVLVNNKALVYQKKGNYRQSISLYRSVIGKVKADTTQYARVMTNLAISQWLQDSSYRAAPALMESMRLREAAGDQWGLNSSYAHLADYYAHSNADSAMQYASKMYAISRVLRSPDDEMEALQKLIALEQGGLSRSYFTRYQQLADSLQTARSNAKNQFALIRYDAEKNLADNLRLQRDNTQKRLQLLVQRVLLVSAVAVLVLGTAWAWWWYRKRKQKMLWEAEQALREQELKTSQKVHDVVANGLYRLMASIEHSTSLDKLTLLDSIEELYEKSRDISYETAGIAQAGFEQTIAELLVSFASPATDVIVAGNETAVWNGLDTVSRQELLPVLQELMVNMKKHSGAKNVFIRFERGPAWITIKYSDDGIGLSPAVQYGNGWRNTENRIKGLGGRINFDTVATKGLSIEIQIPINRQ